MKNQKGITLVSLLVYIIVMIIIIGGLSTISYNFYRNTQALEVDTEDIVEFSNFNEYFIKEIKKANNKIDNISEDGTYIVFTDGNSFMLNNKSIYYNQIEISKNVNSLKFEYDKDKENNEITDIIKVSVEYSNYSKQMKYKLEEIY